MNPYLERVLLERRPEVARLKHENDLVKFELVGSADNSAIRVHFGFIGPWNGVSFGTNLCSISGPHQAKPSLKILKLSELGPSDQYELILAGDGVGVRYQVGR